jgi:hypothetical protein
MFRVSFATYLRQGGIAASLLTDDNAIAVLVC